jgi:uncharacterized protein (TIGR02246 family)
MFWPRHHDSTVPELIVTDRASGPCDRLNNGGGTTNADMVSKELGTADSSVTAFFGKLADAWKTNDRAAFAGLFTEDGSPIKRADGRAALPAMYTEYFGGMLHGTTTSITLTTLRAIGDDYAFADADQMIYSVHGEVVLALHVVNLLRRQDAESRLVDSRPYAFPPPSA